MHNSSHGAGRQAGSSPSLSGLFTRFPSIRLIYVLTLLGLREAKHSARGKKVHGVSEEICACVLWKIVRNSGTGSFSLATHVFLCA